MASIPQYAPSSALTPEEVSNRQLTPSGSSPTSGGIPPTANGPSSLSDPASLGAANNANAGAASNLSSYLSTGNLSPSESSYESGIMDRYNQTNANTKSAYQDQYGAISKDYGNQLDQLNRDVSNDTNTASENNMGVNASVMKYYMETGQNRIATLENARDEALLNNHAEMAKSLNQNIIDEQNLITTARQNYVSNLSAAANLQTPEQKVQLATQQAQQASVVQMQQLAPDSGITSNDTYDQAIAKFRNSKYYQNNIGQGEATIQQLHAEAAQAGASAGASSASAAQTRTLTGLMGTPTSDIPQSDPDVQYLLNGGTVEGLQKRYAGTPQAVKVPNIIAAAQNYGYDQNNANINYQALENNTNATSGGNLYNMAGATAGRALPFVWNALQLNGKGQRTLTAPSSNSAKPSSGVTPSGIKYTISP